MLKEIGDDRKILISLAVQVASACLDLEDFVREYQHNPYIHKKYDKIMQGLNDINKGYVKISQTVADMKTGKKHKTIEYLDEEHVYLINGVIVPSVTQLLEKKFPNKYKNIPKEILKQAAKHGTKIHKAIENYEAGVEQKLTIMQDIAIENYKDIKLEHKIFVTEQEQIVTYDDVYAGRFDMIAKVGNTEKTLIDIKTTSELDTDYISWQLSLYNYAREQSQRVQKLACIWLPKNKPAEYVEIDMIPDKEVEEFLGWYTMQAQET